MLQWLKHNTIRMVSGIKTNAPPRPGAGSATALRREVAGVAGDLWAQGDAYLGVRPNRDPLLASRQGAGAYAYPYGLFEEALDKDAHLAALVAQRKSAVLAWERQVVPADDSPAARQAAELVELALDHIGSTGGGHGGPPHGPPHGGQDGGFERDLWELLDAVPYGLAVSEVLWAPDAAGAWLLPRALKSRHPRRFVFAPDGELRLLTPAEPFSGEAVAPRKFLVFAPYGRHEDPYGLPALRSVWWLAYFKRQVLRFWVAYCEKYGTPTAVLKHPLGATEREKAAFRRIIGSLQQETGLVVPEGVELSLLEAQRGGGAEGYHALLRFCNEEMSKALVGQTLSTEATERGARSLGEVHLAVREDIVRQDAQALMALINSQLVRWIVDLNLPPGARRYPQWRLSPPRRDDLALQLQIDGFFQQAGLSLDTAELYARYGRKQPESETAGEQESSPYSVRE